MIILQLLTLLFSVFLAAPLQAAIFSYIDNQGNTVYTDVPNNNQAKPITLSPKKNESTITGTMPNTIAPMNAPISSMLPITGGETAPVSYTTFAIISPLDQATIQNDHVIVINFKVEPALQPGYQIQVLVDGKLWGAPVAATTINLANVERGTHQIGAQLLDANKQIVKTSNSVTIYIHRPGINSPARAT